MAIFGTLAVLSSLQTDWPLESSEHPKRQWGNWGLERVGKLPRLMYLQSQTFILERILPAPTHCMPSLLHIPARDGLHSLNKDFLSTCQEPSIRCWDAVLKKCLPSVCRKDRQTVWVRKSCENLICCGSSQKCYHTVRGHWGVGGYVQKGSQPSCLPFEYLEKISVFPSHLLSSWSVAPHCLQPFLIRLVSQCLVASLNTDL